MDGRPQRAQPDEDDEELNHLRRELAAVKHRLEVIAKNAMHKIADLEYRIAGVIEKRSERH